MENSRRKNWISPQWIPRVDYKTLEKKLGFQFKNKELLLRALTPPPKDKDSDYQELEYFGDGALRYVMPHILKSRFPRARQGELSRMYSLITCNTNLAFMAYRLRLPYYIRFSSRPSINRKILADVVEAILGAVDRASGIKEVEEVCRKIFSLDIELARFHEPQDTLIRLVEDTRNRELLRKSLPPHSRLRDGCSLKLSYQVHVIRKKWGKLGHVSVLRLENNIIVANGEGYDAESANSHAASIALLKLFPSKFPSYLSDISWRL
jgi:dsRNA-specific ribonuclease